jgi:hypothetical protein
LKKFQLVQEMTHHWLVQQIGTTTEPTITSDEHILFNTQQTLTRPYTHYVRSVTGEKKSGKIYRSENGENKSGNIYIYISAFSNTNQEQICTHSLTVLYCCNLFCSL